VLRGRQPGTGLGPGILFPLRLRGPVAAGVCLTELALGAGLVVTAGRRGAGVPATLARAATAVLFLIAVGTLMELRERRPGAGCGCFGDLSVTPVGARAIARAVVLALAAIATIGQEPLRMPTSAGAAGLRIGLLSAELAVIGALSPEIGEAMIRLGYSEPCEVRRIGVERTLAALAHSGLWRRYAGLITSAAPADIWREGCWRYVLYTGEAAGRRVDVVFAVYLRVRRPQIRAAVLDEVAGEVLTDPPGQPGAAQDRPPASPRPAATIDSPRDLAEFDTGRLLPVTRIAGRARPLSLTGTAALPPSKNV
jgi:hypothetical protein